MLLFASGVVLTSSAAWLLWEHLQAWKAWGRWETLPSGSGSKRAPRETFSRMACRKLFVGMQNHPAPLQASRKRSRSGLFVSSQAPPSCGARSAGKTSAGDIATSRADVVEQDLPRVRSRCPEPSGKMIRGGARRIGYGR